MLRTLPFPATITPMASTDRLSGLDASFLHLERGGAHMHIASCLVFDGAPPSYADLSRHIRDRLVLVPRYRQRLAQVPLRQGRPVWVDDPHFNLSYHLRHTALPDPGGDAELSALCGRVFASQLDRSKPLWEMYLVEGLSNNRFALLAKTHHALVDGVSGVDLATVLFDLEKDPPRRPASTDTWAPEPAPSPAELLSDALLERLTIPSEMQRGLRSALRRPRRTVRWATSRLSGLGNLASAGTEPAPDTPLNVAIGSHRRFTWVEVDLDRVKSIRRELGTTLNDVILAAVTGALRRFLRTRGISTNQLELRAMVPVSVRAEDQHGELGNQVAAMWAPLPVGEADTLKRLARLSEAMNHVKESGQAVGAHALTEMAGFAPQTILSQAARLLPRQRFFNLVVTNVPGPQFPLWMLGHRLIDIYPMVPLAEGQALGVAVISYDGRIFFGLNADWDAMPDLDLLAEDMRESIRELEAAIEPVPALGRRSSSRTRGRAAKMAT